jgi:UDP-N-acetylmuramoylalanine--D-glutamate ligase
MIALRQYQDKKLGVFGLATAGTATVSALIAGGAEVFAWDDKENSRKAFERQFTEGKVRLLEPANWPWKDLAALVLSPGVPLTHPVPHYTVVLAKDAGVRVTGDIELLCEAQPLARKIAITGTNGKSTTTSLIGHILKSSGRRVETGGNLGTSALSLAPQGSDGCYVLELSSYQLDLLHAARFNIALLLNITPDHLDRHGGMEGYVAAKSHIFERQTKHDAALVGIDDDYSRSVYTALRQTNASRIVGISVTHELKQGIFVDKEGMLHDKLEPENPAVFNLHDISPLTGRHNWQNGAFAYAACKLAGLSVREIEKGFKSFPGLRHRLQFVAAIHGVRFINDSKATNADAASHALAPFNNIYWIAGGRPKEGGIVSLEPFFPNIAHAFLIGEAERQFAATLEGRVPYTRCQTLAKAFEAATEKAFAERRPGAVVLLSPACASWDQWKNFEERGDAFCTMAEKLLDKVVGGKK